LKFNEAELMLNSQLTRPEEIVPSSPAVKEALQPFVDTGALAGAVALVADKDRIVSLDAVGYADAAARKLIKPDAVFWIASQTKPMTASLLMMLIDEGRVNLDDAVEKYLPEFAGQWMVAEQDEEHMLLKRPSRPASVRDLLCHISGLPFRTALEQPTLDALPLNVGVGSYAMTPLQTDPGAVWSYSNSGINTIGRIVEVVGGMSYWEFLKSRLLDPLGMAETTFWPSAEQLTRLAKPYEPNAEKTGLQETTISQLQYPLDNPQRQPMPAGGLFSTATDVAKFCQMALSGGVFEGKRLLSEKAVADMTTRQTPPNIEQSFGLGWGVGEDTFGHGGALSTDMVVNRKHGLILVYLVQHAGFPLNGGEALGAFHKVVLNS